MAFSVQYFACYAGINVRVQLQGTVTIIVEYRLCVLDVFVFVSPFVQVIRDDVPQIGTRCF